MSFKLKLAFIFIFNLAINMIVMGIALFFINTQVKKSFHEYKKSTELIDNIGDIKVAVNSEILLWKNILLAKDNKDTREEIHDKLEKVEALVSKRLEDISADIHQSELKEFFIQAIAHQKEFEKAITNYYPQFAQKNINFDKANEDSSELSSATVSKMNKISDGLNDSLVETENLLYSQLNKLFLYSGFLILAIGSVILTISQFYINRSIQAISQFSEKLLSESLDLQNSAKSTQEASQELSQSTNQQASAIQETVASMEEMTSMIIQSNKQSSHSLEISEVGKDEAQKTQKVLTRLTHAMEEIHASNTKLENLIEVISEIKNKTKVINDIVFETRLLSFNASIEAARAGVHGKGFAVVAEEVGKLASMSGKSADEIRTLLDSSTHQVAEIVRDTQEKVNTGKNISLECEETFKTMESTLEKINENIKQITSASKEQEQGVKQTNRAMIEMDKATNQNSTSAENLFENSNKLSHISKTLNHTVYLIMTVLHGDKTKNETPNESKEAS